MIDTLLERHPVEVLAADFAERYRRGERPSLTEYVVEHPELAEQIRALFPTVAVMEDLKRDLLLAESPTGYKMPERLGDYRVLREVGRGGMGIVYEAEQESLGRHVAVKVLTAQALLDPDHLRRFQREARTMAQLHHTNIIPVFAVGEHDGLPYYVMQFIEGRGLDQVIRSQESGDRSQESGKQDDTFASSLTPDPCLLTPDRVARIGLQVAEALHYAHQQGTLHRDVKPSNLLLDDRDVVWVTDFGLAKLTQQGDATRPGEMAGTLRYMAPERFQGRSDARGDVYSLGLTLYELLTLRPAFDEPDHGQLVRQVLLEEPPSPRRWVPGIPRDLETVVLKAMSRDPAHRYQTAGEMADDLRRFLEDKPVRARPVRAPERFWRWCRRNPVIAGLTVLAAGLLLLVAVGATVGYMQALAALGREAALREEAEEHRGRAETNLRLARAATTREAEQRQETDGQRQRAEANLTLALRAFETIFAQTTHRDVLRPLETAEDEENEPAFSPVVSPESAALLNNLLQFFEQFGERNRSDPRLKKETAKAYRCVGDIQQRLGQFEKAESAYRRALALHEERTKAFPEETECGREVAAIQNELGLVLQTTGRYDEAEKMHRQALEALQAQAKRTPRSARCRYELARTHNLLGSVLWKTGRRDEAEDHHRRALDLLEELSQEDPINPDYRFAQARGYRNLFSVLSPKGRREGAGTAYRKAITILEELANDFPDVPDYRYELGEVLMLSGPGERGIPHSQTAERRLRRAMDLAKELAVAYPAVPQYQALRARSFQLLGTLLQVSGRSQEAEQFHRDAVELHRSLVSQFPSVPVYQLYLAEACQSLGTILLHRGELTETSSLLREAIAAQQAYLKAMPKNRNGQLVLARQYLNLEKILRRQGEPAQAKEAARNAEKARKGL
jgi:serine/threonine protein kinase/tetratricopeptide (TPR) repeat protein